MNLIDYKPLVKQLDAAISQAMKIRELMLRASGQEKERDDGMPWRTAKPGKMKYAGKKGPGGVWLNAAGKPYKRGPYAKKSV